MNIRKWLAEVDEELLCADGLDDAILGVCERAGSSNVVAYDAVKCVDILMDSNGWDWDEASEYFDFNVVGAYMGDRTPVFITYVTPEASGLTALLEGAILPKTE